MFNVAVSVLPNVQVVGDLGYARKSDRRASLTTFTGGVRYVVPRPASRRSLLSKGWSASAT